MAERPRSNGIRALVIDHQQVFRLGLRLYLSEAMPDLDLVAEADSADEGLTTAARERPDLVLLDAFIRGRQTHVFLAELCRLLPQCRVLLLGDLPDAAGWALALQAGARGYLLKTSAHQYLPTAIQAVLRGHTWVQPEIAQQIDAEAGRERRPTHSFSLGRPRLTPRERDVLRLVALGLSNSQIASRLFVSPETVKTHIAHLLRKLDVRTRTQAASYAIQNGLRET
jgi:DNA-binding NarL/FixJ family response regulator